MGDNGCLSCPLAVGRGFTLGPHKDKDIHVNWFILNMYSILEDQWQTARDVLKQREFYLRC